MRPAHYVVNDFTAQALATDATLKSITAQIEVLNERYQLNLNKSEELKTTWENIIKSLDDYIKSLSTVPFKKIITYTACGITIIGFLCKMGMLRSIPNFLGNSVVSALSTVANSVPTPEQLPSPKPDLDFKIKDIMDTPLTPIGLVTIVGGITITLGTIRVVLWALNRLPK